jgi:chitin disaccharide deacetylase
MNILAEESGTHPMVIVNADDFGISSRGNKAIIACFEEGLISSTTIMANMPGFEEASNLAHQYKLIGNIGIHMNLSEGQPLTDPIRKMAKFCNPDGDFSFSCSRWRFFSPYEKSALASEIRAQVELCRTYGLPLTHADSHHHIHTIIPVFLVMGPLLKQLGIHNIRIAGNLGAISPAKKGLSRVFNYWAQRNGFHTTKYFGDIFSFIALLKKQAVFSSSIDIMIHPTLDENGILTDSFQHYQIKPVLSSALHGIKIEPYPF